MNTLPQWLPHILKMNALLVLAYGVYSALFVRRKDSWLIRALIMLLCPIVGVSYFFLSWLLFRFVFRKPVDLSSVVFSKDRVEAATKPNEELERNFVPLEEALAVTDQRNLRELMMDIIRRDYRQSLPTLALALNSEDSETSHYAASVLQDVLNDFRVDVQKEYRALMDESADRNWEAVQIQANELMESLDTMLQNHVLSDLEQEYYAHLMEQVAEKICSEGGTLDSTMMESMALRLMEVEDYASCEQWCQRIMQQYPETLCAFTTRLKLYYTNGEREKFFVVLEQLKQSNVIVDQQTLNLIRAFM